MAKFKKRIDTKSELVATSADHVMKLLKEELSDKHQYHNLDFTFETASIAQKLSQNTALDDEQRENISVAALFHTTGYTQNKDRPYLESATLVEKFLKKQGTDPERIQLIKKIVKSLAEDDPDTIEEQILHDAVIAEIGRKRFFRRSELLRLERRLVYGEEFTELEWQKMQQDKLVKNDFKTLAAKRKYGKRRAKNVEKQRKNIQKGYKVSVRKNTGKDLGRGVDTIYRSAYRNHINLSSIADGKANMMISINTLILSVIVTLSGAGLSFSNEYILEHMRFVVPIILLLLSSLISVIFAVLSAKPDVTAKEANELKDINLDKNSLLYFGNFLEVNIEDFKKYMNILKMDQEKLYNSMSIDLYMLGVVLKKKYRLISISYAVFMYGLILCVISFLIIFIYTQNFSDSYGG